MTEQIGEESTTGTQPLLKISNLKVHFDTMDGPVEALHDVSLRVDEGQIMGIVGESGCGKSVTSLTSIGLATCEVDEGSITFRGEEMVFKEDERNKRIEAISTRVSIASVFLSLISMIWILIEPVQGATFLLISLILLSGGVGASYKAKMPARIHERFLRTIRGNEISMIFQEPMTALNPLYTVEKQISEVMMEHDRLEIPELDAMSRTIRALSKPLAIIAELFSSRPKQSLATSLMIVLVLAQGTNGPLKDWDEWVLFGGLDAINVSWLLFPLVPILATSGIDEKRLLHALSLSPSSFSLALVLYMSLWIPFSVFLSILGVFAMFALPSIMVSDYLKLDPVHRSQVIEILKQVQIPNPDAVVSMYPHELSGGMRQRIMIAMMMSCEPTLLIADEPTTALDVTIQAQILSLMRDLRKDRGTSIMLITHDLGVIAEMCDAVTVMYAGSVVERGDLAQVLSSPRMPYTIGLLHSIPTIEHHGPGTTRESLPIIPGQVPDPNQHFDGCRFHPRCPFAIDECVSTPPGMVEVGPSHYAACHRTDLTTEQGAVRDAFDEFSLEYVGVGGDAVAR